MNNIYDTEQMNMNYEEISSKAEELLSKHFYYLVELGKESVYYELYADAILILNDYHSRNKPLSGEELKNKLDSYLKKKIKDVAKSDDYEFDDKISANASSERLDFDNEMPVQKERKENQFETLERFRSVMTEEEYTALISKLDQGSPLLYKLDGFSMRRVQLLYRRARVKYCFYKDVR